MRKLPLQEHVAGAPLVVTIVTVPGLQNEAVRLMAQAGDELVQDIARLVEGPEVLAPHAEGLVLQGLEWVGKETNTVLSVAQGSSTGVQSRCEMLGAGILL